ncbi:MAG TPA: hypothetical protein VHF22_11525, partial [Planctomycetota bacterium]|nr:hypothetical protein [Planctomycetota bacterium]
MYRNVAVGAVVCLVGLASLLAPLARAADGEKAPAWRKCRPDAPEEPKAVTPYACAYPEMPKDWKPPATLDELEKSVPQWTDFPLKDAMKIGRERAESMKPLCSVEEALKLKNDSAEDNKKILSALCQYPKSDDEVDWDATINRWSGPPNTLNPILASSKYEFDMTGLIGAGYLAFDHKLRPFGDTDSVKRWRRSPLVELIELRDDLV